MKLIVKGQVFPKVWEIANSIKKLRQVEIDCNQTLRFEYIIAKDYNSRIVTSVLDFSLNHNGISFILYVVSNNYSIFPSKLLVNLR